MNKNYLLNFHPSSMYFGKVKRIASTISKSTISRTVSIVCLFAMLAFVSTGTCFGATRTTTLSGGGNAAANVYPGESNVLIYSFKLAQTNGANIMTGLSFTTTGTATTSDIGSYSVFIQNSSVVAGSSLTAMSTSPIFIGTVAFTAGGATYTVTVPNEMYIAIDNYYVYIQANFLTTAVAGHTIAVSAEGDNITMTGGITWGANTCTAGGIQTVTATCAQYYAYTGGSQTYTVPVGCNQLAITAAGASGGAVTLYGGGNYINSGGGLGGLVSETMPVTSGGTYTVNVGGMGSNGAYFTAPATSGGFNGGGVGGAYFGLLGGGCGGGASDVNNGPYTLGGANLLVVAGGGGGGAWVFENWDYDHGGAGGANTAAAGIYDNAASTKPGQGGTQIAGGAAGIGSFGANGQQGSLNDGGNGDYGYYNAGGGGGYYGGGSGAEIVVYLGADYYSASGGGGSSFVPATATGTSNTAGVNAGNGYVIITPVVAVYTVTGGGSYCVGGSGVTIGLNGSQVGVNYQVYDGSTATGGIVAGTGTAITSLGTFTAAGTYTVSGTLACGGAAVGMSGSVVVSINAVPSINGNLGICGTTGTTSLSDATAGGTWSTVAGTGSVTLSGTTGTPITVTGATVGTATVSYVQPGGCIATSIVTVSASPGIITGNMGVCTTLTTTLTATGASGGTWSEINGTGTATVGAGTGIVTGGGLGTVTISYSTGPSCAATATVTVYGTPGIINGTANICGTDVTASLSDGTSGGTWTSSNSLIASVGSTGNPTLVTGGSTFGTATITYSMGGTCYVTTTATVNPLPTAILGYPDICTGATTSLTDAVGGGTWSSSNGNATIGTGGGITNGVSTGTSVISYITGSNCYVTTIVTVYAAVGTIAGGYTVCQGLTTSLGDATAGGIWTSSNTLVATVGSTGFFTTVTGVSAGTVNITYSTGGSCYQIQPMTVTGIPTTITGNPIVCSGASINLTDGASGGVWSTSSGAMATIGSTAALSPGSTAQINSVGPTGTVTITYTTGCLPNATVVLTVTAAPAAIQGVASVCVGANTSLSDATPGGTWSSSSPLIGSVGSTSGIVTGLNSGTTTIFYTTICGNISEVVTVNSIAVAGTITGPGTVCTGLTIPLSDATASGGTGAWSSGNTAIGTVGATTGVVYGVSQGTVTITYTETSPSCGSNYTTTVVTVNPSPIAGTIGSAGFVCQGSTIQLSDATASGGTGTWSSSIPTNGSIGSTSGIVTGINVGTTTITYTETSAFCGSATTTTVVTVNVSPLAGAITGPGSVCTTLTIPLSDATASGGSGVWSSSNTAIGTVGATTGIVYGVSQGTVTITYTEISASCGSVFTTTIVTVNPSPIAGTIGSAGFVCQGSTIQLSDATASGGTGTWSSSIPTNGSIGSTSGIVTGINVGTTTITYTETSAFCGSATTTTVVTVNVSPLAGAITGPGSVCTTLTIPLSDATASGGSGVWSSSNTAIGTVGATTGIVYGVSQGTVTITYTEISASCGSVFTTTTVTVNISPFAGTIGSAGFVCVGSTIQLSDATASGGTGTWSSSIPSNGSVGSTSGIVTGINVGTTTIIYTETSAFCGSATTTTIVTVDVSPFAGTITGPGSVCTGLTIPLSDATASGGAGVWSSGNTSVATVGATTGVVDGISQGTATITYTVTSPSCGSAFTTFVVTVNISPFAGTIGSAGDVCQGSTIQLSDATASGGTGTWSSSIPTNGSISTTGVVTGINVGTTTIIYTETSAFCGSATATTVVTINVSPVAGTITGPGSVCTGLTIPLSDATASGGTGVWSSSNTAIGTVGATTGVLYGVSQGTTTITYTVTSASCGSVFTTMTVTVNISPFAGIIVSPGYVCVGSTIQLSDATASGGTGTWSSSIPTNGSIGSTSGIVTGINVGTTTITYTETSAFCGSATTTTVVTVDVSPVAGIINGPAAVCVGLTIPLTDITSAGGTGAWSSSNTAIGTVGATTGIVYGVSGGIVTITYTETSASCGAAFTTVNVTVNANPSPITGTTNVCVGLTTTLNSTPGGGTWSSESAAVGTVGLGTGIVYGATPGTTTIVYKLGTGCLDSATVTVNPNPAPITGITSVCVGLTTSLSSTTGGGTWSSSSAIIGTVGSTTGVVYGSSQGTTTITYELGTGCLDSTTVTVNPNPTVITGTLDVCIGLTTTLNSTPAGGTWSSTSGLVSVNASSGAVTGINQGTAVITYTLSTGCIITAIVTINPLPSAISGILSVCVGSTTSLSDAGGGTWMVSNGNAGIAGGLVFGTTAGLDTVTYTLPTGCIATAIVTVNPLPATITGSMNVCAGLTTALSDATAGGTWISSAPGTGSIGSTSGIVTGENSGTTTITYKLTATGCLVTATVNVEPVPSAISGILNVCVGLTTSLSDISGGGTWSSSNTNVAVGTSGIVTGNTAGTSIITYAFPTGCIATAIVTVNSLPGAILGNLAVCSGSITSLSDATGGGTWSSSATIIASVGSTSGIVTGGTVLVTSTATITYTIGTGCIMTAIVTVNPLPTAILGIDSVCSGLTTSLSDAAGPGTWVSSAPGIASVVSGTGIVTGGTVLTTSTAIITYSLTGTGCETTVVVTVNPLPTAILGIDSVCSGSQVTLSDASGTGTWASSATGVATIGATSGVVTGQTVVTSSTSVITFTLITGCTTTTTITVNPLPATITGTLDVCAGQTTALADASTPGTWSIAGGTGVGSIVSSTGVLSTSVAGTIIVDYTLITGCQTSTVVTVNPLPGAILGTLSVCQGLQTSLSDGSAGGTWSSSNTSVATVSGSGLVNGTATGTVALTATITYTLPTGCTSTAIVTVNPLPGVITGVMHVCSGLTTTLSDVTPGGTWSSSASGIASIGSTTGVVTGESVSTASTATIIYKLTATGCIETAIVTVNPLPTAILGVLKVCSGLTTSLSDLTPLGTWSSSDPGIAAVGSGTGIVTGETVAVTSEAIITYTLPTGCITIAIVTVNPLPAAIEGSLGVCLGLTTHLTDAASGGTWSSSNTHALIGSVTGIITGNSVGTSLITYTLPTGCIMTAIATVNPLPAAIAGTLNVCVGLTTQLSDATTGGTWTSSNTSIGSAGSGSGIVTGVFPGTVTITYTLPTGCISTIIVTVNPQPDSIKGIAHVCYEETTSLSDATTGGIWSSSNASIASVGSTGLVYGAGPGNATISYTLAAGCTAIDIVTVNPLPQVYTITPTSGSYCEGGSGGVILGLNGSAVGVSYELFYYSSATGYDSSVTGYVAGTGDSLSFGHEYIAGTYTVLATNSTTGCTATMAGTAFITVIPTVNPMVSILSLSGDTVCPGTTVTFVPDTTHAGPSPTYKWYVNGVLVSLASFYTYIPANGDIVSVTMNSDYICVEPSTASATLKMTVIPDGLPEVAISIYPGDTVCQYAAATFTATATFGGPTPQYIWYVNGVQQTTTGSEFSYYPTTGDIVYCKMISDYQCRSADTGYSNAAVMTVAPLIVPHVEVLATPGFIITAGQSDSLWTIVTDAGNNPTYQWEINGVPVPGATLSYYVSQFNNYDSVTCVVTSGGYCDGISAFDWAFITVYPLGVQQVASGNSDISLLPNPNQGSFTLRGTVGVTTDEEVTIEVTDMIGQQVYSSKVMVSGGKINEQIKLSGRLANGMYLLNLRSGSDNKVFHFVIEQ